MNSSQPTFNPRQTMKPNRVDEEGGRTCRSGSPAGGPQIEKHRKAMRSARNGLCSRWKPGKEAERVETTSRGPKNDRCGCRTSAFATRNPFWTCWMLPREELRGLRLKLRAVLANLLDRILIKPSKHGHNVHAAVKSVSSLLVRHIVYCPQPNGDLGYVSVLQIPEEPPYPEVNRPDRGHRKKD